MIIVLLCILTPTVFVQDVLCQQAKYMAYVNTMTVTMMNLTNMQVVRSVITDHQPNAITHDPIINELWWTETVLQTNSCICSLPLVYNNKRQSCRREADNARFLPGIIIHPRTRKVLYTSTPDGHIKMLNFDQSIKDPFINRLKYPYAITSDQDTGLIYWTDIAMNTIERIEITGKNWETIVNTSLSAPYGLTIDQYEKRIYWVDADLRTIESANLDGHERTLLFNGMDQTCDGQPCKFQSIFLDPLYIYVSIPTRVLRACRSDRLNLTSIAYGSGIEGIVVFGNLHNTVFEGVKNVTAEAITVGSITVSWPGLRNVDHYELSISPNHGRLVLPISVDRNEERWQFTGLRAASLYNISLKAVYNTTECTRKTHPQEIHIETKQLSSVFGRVQTSNATEELQRITQSRVNERQVENVSSRVKELTQDENNLESKDVVLVSYILEDLAAVKQQTVKSVDNFIDIVDNILAEPAETIIEAHLKTNSSTRTLKALNAFIATSDLGGQDMIKVTHENIAVGVWGESLVDTLPQFFGSFKSDEMGYSEYNITSYSSGQWTEEDASTLDTSIELSTEVLERLQRPEAAKNTGEPIRLSYVIFQNEKLFLAAQDSANEISQSAMKDYPSGPLPATEVSVNSQVMACTVHNVVIKNLTQPVIATFTILKNTSHEHTCVFWDFEADSGAGSWSSEGCYLNATHDDRVVCQCNHLTNFAVLGRFDRSDITDIHNKALGIISTIGLILSIAGTIFTISIYLLFKQFRKERGQKVLFNLAIALLAINVIFLAGINATKNHAACLAVAALLHYFLLVSFAWMMVEAVIHYLKFVIVLGTYMPNFMKKAALSAWLLPAVPVVIVAGVNYELFKGKENYCWLSLPAFYYAFLLPVGIIIFINSILFILVIKGITCDRSSIQNSHTKSDLALMQFKAGVSCFILLGLTWIFGFLAVSNARLVFQYLFCICNAFQGFYIFLLISLINRHAVQDAWRHRLLRKKEKLGDSSYTTNTTQI